MAQNDIEMLLNKATTIEERWFPKKNIGKGSLTKHSLNEIRLNMDISKPTPTEPATGWKGALTTKLKIFLKKISQPIIKLLFKRQIIINEYILDLAVKVHLQQAEIDRLQSELERRK